MSCSTCYQVDDAFVAGELGPEEYVRHILFHVRKHTNKYWWCNECDLIGAGDSMSFFDPRDWDAAFEHVYTHRFVHRIWGRSA